jgi:hypothetical protein
VRIGIRRPPVASPDLRSPAMLTPGSRDAEAKDDEDRLVVD